MKMQGFRTFEVMKPVIFTKSGVQFSSYIPFFFSLYFSPSFPLFLSFSLSPFSPSLLSFFPSLSPFSSSLLPFLLPPSPGYLPNSVLAVEAMLATASIGAVWSSTSPDFGVSVSVAQ